MKCSKCNKECNIIEVAMGSNRADLKYMNISDCCHVEITSDNWKDLDINNLPERFFTRDDIEFTRTETYCNGKIDTVNEIPCDELRLQYIKMILDGTIETIRYRIQEKKPIQITQEVLNVLRNMFVIMGTKEGLEEKLNRKVIIID